MENFFSMENQHLSMKYQHLSMENQHLSIEYQPLSIENDNFPWRNDIFSMENQHFPMVNQHFPMDQYFLLLTLTMLWANSAEDKMMISFLFFIENRSDTSCKLPLNILASYASALACRVFAIYLICFCQSIHCKGSVKTLARLWPGPALFPDWKM